MRLLASLALFLLLVTPGCAHHAPLTIVTTRQNGTVRLCGEIKPGEKMVVGTTPEGTSISINASDIVTMEQNGVCQ